MKNRPINLRKKIRYARIGDDKNYMVIAFKENTTIGDVVENHGYSEVFQVGHHGDTWSIKCCTKLWTVLLDYKLKE